MHIVVVCGSVREKRLSIHAARLAYQKVLDSGNESTLVDFIQLPLPFVDSNPTPNALNKRYPYENVQKWSAIADGADAFILVTPEYNHGYSGVLKNALDWLSSEFEHKPVGLIGVSNGFSGALRAIEALRPVMANFGMYDIRQAVSIRNAQDVFDDSGVLLDEKLESQVQSFVSSLVITAQAMRGLRDKYV